MGVLFTRAALAQQNHCYADTAGVSGNCANRGFVPAFQNSVTGETHLSLFADGTPATVHLLDGLPEDWVLCRDDEDRVTAVLDTIVAGFVRDGTFFTREQVATMPH